MQLKIINAGIVMSAILTLGSLFLAVALPPPQEKDFKYGLNFDTTGPRVNISRQTMEQAKTAHQQIQFMFFGFALLSAVGWVGLIVKRNRSYNEIKENDAKTKAELENQYAAMKASWNNPSARPFWIAVAAGILLCIGGLAQVFNADPTFAEFGRALGGANDADLYFRRAITNPFLLIGLVALVVGWIGIVSNPTNSGNNGE